MRVARWRWVLVLMVVVVAGCLPHPPPDLPASFLEAFSGTNGNPTFTVQPPPAGKTGQDLAAALRADEPMFRGRAVPVFGILDCHGAPACTPGTVGEGSGAARSVWVLLYPDCTRIDDPTDVGWVVVDAVNGLESGYTLNEPCRKG